MKKDYLRSLGYSLIEMLVVISIFSMLGIIITRTIFSTLSGAQKTDNLVKVRENINQAFSVIERHLRNANEITSCNNNYLYYKDKDNDLGVFYCYHLGFTDGSSIIASGSATTAKSLTTPSVEILSCNITCDFSVSPQKVTISVTAQDNSADNTHKSPVTESTQIFLRNYH